MIKLLFTILSFGCMALQAGAAMPNIVYILADDMGQGDVSAYNPEGKIPTPNIDRIASEGMLFMDAHTSSSVCTPTRYGILTGRYAWRTSLKEGVLGPYSLPLIDADRETVGSFLQKQGYRTGCFGKWHLGYNWQSNGSGKGGKLAAKQVEITVPFENGPLTRGFDHFLGTSPNELYYVKGNRAVGDMEFLSSRAQHKKYTDVKLKRTEVWADKGFSFEGRLGCLAEDIDRWIREKPEQPFFVYMPLPSPHNPIVPSKAFVGKTDLGPHGDYCVETDWAVGQVLKTLESLGLEENTLIIFTADNGTSSSAGIKGMQNKGHFPSHIYRAAKGSIFEGGHRVPFVLRWPKEVEAGEVSDQTICSTDLLATLAEITGRDHAGEDSVSFLPALKGEAIPGGLERMIVHHDRHGFFAVRKGKWKLVLDAESGRSNDTIKSVSRAGASAAQMLFDMEKDERETTNLIEQYPELVDNMKQEFVGIIQRGRSTPGENAEPVSREELEAWAQLDPVRSYLQ